MNDLPSTLFADRCSFCKKMAFIDNVAFMNLTYVLTFYTDQMQQLHMLPILCTEENFTFRSQSECAVESIYKKTFRFPKPSSYF